LAVVREALPLLHYYLPVHGTTGSVPEARDSDSALAYARAYDMCGALGIPSLRDPERFLDVARIYAHSYRRLRR